MEKKTGFRVVAVGGFDKKEVNDYIAQLAEDFEQEREKLQSRIEELERSNKKTEDSLEQANRKLQQLERDYTHMNSESSSSRSEKDSLLQSNQQLNQEISSLRMQVAELQKELNESNSTFSEKEEKYQEYLKQKEEVDRASFQLGKVMLEARTDADLITTNARQEAQQLMDLTQKEADSIRQQAMKEAQETIDTAQSKAVSIVDAAQLEATQLAKEISDENARRLTAAEQESQAVVAVSMQRAKEILEQTQKQVDELESTRVQSTKEAANQLDVMRKETQAIRQVLNQTLSLLQERGEQLESSLDSARKKVADADQQIYDENTFVLPTLTQEEIQQILFQNGSGNSSESVPETALEENTDLDSDSQVVVSSGGNVITPNFSGKDTVSYNGETQELDGDDFSDSSDITVTNTSDTLSSSDDTSESKAVSEMAVQPPEKDNSVEETAFATESNTETEEILFDEESDKLVDDGGFFFRGFDK